MQIFVVEGERFAVDTDDAKPASIDVTWLSGPNPGYGFTSARSDGGPYTEAEIERSIRTFLGQVDPSTGFIEDE